jgi:hypothetical protein
MDTEERDSLVAEAISDYFEEQNVEYPLFDMREDTANYAILKYMHKIGEITPWLNYIEEKGKNVGDFFSPFQSDMDKYWFDQWPIGHKFEPSEAVTHALVMGSHEQVLPLLADSMLWTEEQEKLFQQFFLSKSNERRIEELISINTSVLNFIQLESDISISDPIVDSFGVALAIAGVDARAVDFDDLNEDLTTLFFSDTSEQKTVQETCAQNYARLEGPIIQTQTDPELMAAAVLAKKNLHR